MRIKDEECKDLKRRSGEEGFTLLEIIIAISILTIGILGVASMQSASIRGNDLAGDVSEATCLATDQIESMLRQPYADLTSSTSPVTRGIYSITWNVVQDQVYNDTATVTVVVTWQRPGSPKSITVRRVIPKII